MYEKVAQTYPAISMFCQACASNKFEKKSQESPETDHFGPRASSLKSDSWALWETCFSYDLGKSSTFEMSGTVKHLPIYAEKMGIEPVRWCF